MDGNYLLIIDPAPVEADLIHYFSQFRISIAQEEHARLTSTYPQPPYALVIDYSALQEDPEIVRTFYQKYPVPLLITSAQRNEAFCISMLELGADDFLIKPLYPRELHARINAIKRRVSRIFAKSETECDVLKFDHWTVYPYSRKVFDHKDRELILSVGEYDLLFIFLQNPQKILTRDFLCRLTKSHSAKPLNRRIDIQISRLRQKIEYDATKPSLIKTIRNRGYLFTCSVTISQEKKPL